MKTKRIFLAGLFLMMVVMITAVFTTLSAKAAVNQVITVTMANDVVSGIDGQCSLREAVIAANTNSTSGILVGECSAGSDAETDIITLADGLVYTLSIAGNGEDASATGDLDITDDLPLFDIQFVVAGNGSATIDASSIGDDDRVLHILGAGVELNNITISGGDAKIGIFAAPGGGIYNDNGSLTMNGGDVQSNRGSDGSGIYNAGTIIGKGIITLNNVSVILNNATNNGGGIASVGSRGVVTLSSGTLIRANTSAASGGGVYMDNGTLTVGSSFVNLNTAPTNGGGIYAKTGATVEITNSGMETNSTQGSGGAVYLDDASSMDNFMLKNTTITGNHANGNGGGLYAVSTGSVAIQDSTFTNNDTGSSGGAISASTAVISGSTFDSNDANGGAGALDIPSLDISNSTLMGNTAVVSGGAIWSQDLSASTIVVKQNQGGLGGGIYLTGVVSSDITRSAIVSNTATSDGGGIWINDNALTISNSTISTNGATGNGGGFYIGITGAVTATNVTIAFNKPAQDIYKFGDLTLQNSIIFTPGTDNCVVALGNPMVISLGNNLSDDTSCPGLAETTDEINVNVSLGLLQDNGGNTLTHDLLDGSPAIDTGNLAACTGSLTSSVDQRGIPRPIGAACDKGAVERGSAVYLPIILK